MRLFRIQSSRVFLSLFVTLLLGLISLLPSKAVAQACTGGLMSSTQTVTLAGTGGNYYNPVFSQYNPPAGYVLVSAVVQTTVSLSGSISLKNNSVTTQGGVLVGAAVDDELTIGGNVIQNDDGSYSDAETPYANFPPQTVPGGSTITVGPSTLINNKKLEYDSISNADTALNYFVGTGSPDLGYYNYVFTQLSNSNISTTPDLNVSITFSLTYYYCDTYTLAANFLSFTATLENPQTVLLNWMTANETPGERYVVQVSNGSGSDFRNVDTVTADGVAGNGNYAYNYMIQPTDKGNIYFRLQLLGPNGPTGYSQLRVINLNSSGTSAFLIYPNPPTSFINVSFPGNSQNWQVQIYAANGDLVQENYFANTNLATVYFNHKMAAGAYFVRAVNSQTNEHHAASFVIKD